MADIFCTFIATAAQRNAAITAASAVPGGADMFDMPLRAIGGGVTTHYASSGFVRPAIHAALVGLCTIDTTHNNTADALQAAGLEINRT